VCVAVPTELGHSAVQCTFRAGFGTYDLPHTKSSIELLQCISVLGVVQHSVIVCCVNWDTALINRAVLCLTGLLVKNEGSQQRVEPPGILKGGLMDVPHTHTL
jgi:hypothetical protein